MYPEGPSLGHLRAPLEGAAQAEVDQLDVPNGPLRNLLATPKQLLPTLPAGPWDPRGLRVGWGVVVGPLGFLGGLFGDIGTWGPAAGHPRYSLLGFRVVFGAWGPAAGGRKRSIVQM